MFVLLQSPPQCDAEHSGLMGSKKSAGALITSRFQSLPTSSSQPSLCSVHM